MRKSYEKYKDSGIEWIGEVPKHWGIKKIKHIAERGLKTFVDGDWVETPYIANEGIRLIQTGNIGIGQYKEQGFRYITEQTFEELNCTEVKPADILICRLAHPVGRACLAPNLNQKMITSVDVCILKPKSDVDRRYVVYYLSCNGYLESVDIISRGGTRQRISRSQLGSQYSLIPQFKEQILISDFLDRKTSEIDSLIADKEKLIQRLQEYKQSVITEAVTKGLNPDVKMKDSGVEWIGEMPEHWKVKKIKHLVNNGLQNGLFKSKVEFGFGTKIVNVFDIYRTDRNIEPDLLDRVNATTKEIDLYEVFENDIFFVRSSLKKEGVAASAIVKKYFDPLVFECHLIKVSPKADVINPELLINYLNIPLVRDRLISLSQTITMTTIAQPKISSLEVIVPPINEQVLIIKTLNKMIININEIVDGVQSQIEKLKEYRQSLTYEAVTGKIDLRDYNPEKHQIERSENLA